MTDPNSRALIKRMADELDRYRHLLMDDRRETHALATEARAYLAQPKPMTEPRLVVLLAWKIADYLSKSRPGDDCIPFAQDVILEVAAWLRRRNVRIRASVEIAGDLEREAGR
jgi:hypothetical protein